jgi:Na+-transporting NADH:ubiquinone oxidoreductase subunit F
MGASFSGGNGPFQAKKRPPEAKTRQLEQKSASSRLSAGMAPMRSHLYHLFQTLKTGRKVTFFYGGRTKQELFYIEEFREIEKQFPNFRFAVALDNPLPEDNWTLKANLDDPNGDGFKGFVHNVVIAEYLSKHPAPEEVELYFCGPPMMNQSVIKMADDWGIPKENVAFDDFGG